MNTDINDLVEQLHASPTMAVVAASGAGAEAIAWLLGVPGASATVLEALVPYDSKSFVEFLGYEPEQFVAADAVEHMARSAYRRAVHLRHDDSPVVGIACTATIATNRPKRGAHRCHVAAWTETEKVVYNLEFVKGLRDRAGEDDIVSRLVLQALAEASGIEPSLKFNLDDRERVEAVRTAYGDPIQALLAEHIGSVVVGENGATSRDATLNGAILAGSFNPIHEGHRHLAQVASRLLNSPVTFELSVTNVDKPPLELEEIRRRIAQFSGNAGIAITRAPVFNEKARIFPGCTFVIGWDTSVRLIDAQYYGNNEAQMLIALEEIRRLGCRFLVAGREHQGAFKTLADVSIPLYLRDMFMSIPESEYRIDISSSDIRETAELT